MVAFITSPIDTLLQPATRARAPSRTCTVVASQPLKSNSRFDLRVTNLTTDTRWGSRSRDPIGYAASSNCLFEYCHGRPFGYVDPWGEQVYLPIPPGRPRKPHQPTDPLKPGWPVPQEKPEYPWVPVPNPTPIPGAKGDFATNCGTRRLPALTKHIGDACACILLAHDLLRNHRDKVIDFYENESQSINKDFILDNLDFYAPKLAFAAKGCSGDKAGCRLCFNCLDDDCLTGWRCPEGRLAYVNFYLHWKVGTCINICPAFFDPAPAGGTEETIIHEIGRYCGRIGGSDNSGELDDVYMWDAVLKSLCNNAIYIRRR